MSSASVLEPQTSHLDVPEVTDLLVLWQHPETREIVPIGRFVHQDGHYTFAYTRAAADVEGFRPLPGLDELRRRYDSDRMPTVFGLRVMEPDRPDYADYLGSIGLDPDRATPWEQIVQSGGTRAGDTLQFMQVPTVTHGRVRARFFANGIRHIPGHDRTVSGRAIRVTVEQHERALEGLIAGQSVLVEPEDGNPTDVCAALLTTDGIPLGWVPRALSASVRELMLADSLTATVVRIGGPGTPPHLRLVVDLDAPAPQGFEFDRDGRWEPLVPG